MAIPIGGKTGTGDDQYKVYDSDGKLISAKTINRSATFAFIVGDRFFGNITAYVPGPSAADYTFTSSLPLAILKIASSCLMPLLTSEESHVSRTHGEYQQSRIQSQMDSVNEKQHPD
jgi:hypothetical protein